MLENISTRELEKESERQTREEKPRSIDNPDITRLQNICCEYINDLASDGYVDEDYEQYIFEAAMETVFGKDVWKFINDKLG